MPHLRAALALLAACSVADERPGSSASATSDGPAAHGNAPGAEPLGPRPGSSTGTPTPPPPAVDAAAPDLNAGKVPVFVAQGKLGRTTMSCDDGKTWIADRSEVPGARCWDDTAAINIECDHHAWSSVGVVAAGDGFLATYGWGYPGVVRRSDDGVNWTDVLPGHTFAGLAVGNGRVLANDREPFVSASAGATGTWTAGGNVGSSVWNVRRIGFVPHGAGRFVITLESGPDHDVRLSGDDGATWRAPITRPAECGANVSNVVAGAGVALIVQGDGSVCRSTDGGDTWTYKKVADAFTSPALFGAGSFFVWHGATRYTSTDGDAWQSTTGSPGNLTIGPVARSDGGTFVAVRGGWQVWYEKQELYRSDDGVTWEVLPKAAFTQGHPLTHLAFGWTRPSAECPLN